MKSRSHRLPISEPHHDDWVDGSWTVDCICGVTFDDGEEMVNCDECGVWVHTRCSRYVKSEKSFACDKCKNKKSGIGTGNDSEETEVAEFLVELPTKTLRMDTPNPACASSHRPVRLWTDIPMEERVHVQGLPGGDPQLFSGIKMSAVFGPALWRSTGYVPKKFNFRYTEFPSVDDGKDTEKIEGEVCKRHGEGSLSQADNGAGVLFSLSKENGHRVPTPLVDSFGVKGPVVSGGNEQVRQKQKLDSAKLDLQCNEDTVKSKSGLTRPIVFRSGKRRKEEFVVSKDQSTKKKIKTVEKDRDVKKHYVYASKPASTLSSDANQLEFSQDRASNAVNDHIHGGQDVRRDQPSDVLGECATNLASNERGPEATLRKNVSNDEISMEGKRGDQVPVRLENFSITNHGVASLAEVDGCRRTSVKEEVHKDSPQRRGEAGGATGSLGLSSHDKEPVAVGVSVADSDSRESQNALKANADEANSRPNKKLKAEAADDRGSLCVQSLSVVDMKSDTMKPATQHQDLSNNALSEEGKAIDKLFISSEATHQKVHDGTIGYSKPDKSDESLGNRHQFKREPSGSEGSTEARKKASGIKHGSGVAKELVRSSGDVSSYSTTSYQRKVVVSVGKFSPAASNIISKSSENGSAAPAQTSTIDSRRKELSQSNTGAIKDDASINTATDVEKCVRPKKLLKESSRLHSMSKVPSSTKSHHTSDAKKMSSDSKDSIAHSPPNVPLVPNIASIPLSGEPASPPQIEGTPNAPNKALGSAVPGKGEKVLQPVSHQSSRGTVVPMTASIPSNIPATLSDEELALLLHQELNSSPRVPRVPRMRHAGSLPQLTCPTASSTLMKRTSSAKDHSVAPKRKTKDLTRDGSHSSLEVGHEAKKIDRKPSSPDNRRRDSGADQLSRRGSEGGVVKGVATTKTTNLSSSLSSSSDANGQNLSSSRPSSRIACDDDPRTVDHQTNRTLPGLIADIMREGKRMTYEELCNAVLPHWPHLRKHNGERYAYSSHSQAVLDCLRNRSEWARLVDRGPKTSGIRKRRKLDTDSMSIESEDNEDSRGKHAKDVGSKSFESHQEDFPKGKRKARKRRRLALQGRGLVRRRRRADVVSDDESESFSNSSEGSMSSEEEIQGGGTSLVGNEASGSSEEAR